MSKKEKLLKEIKNNPKNVRFNDLCKICEAHFGKPTSSGTSHCVYPTPWKGDPRINIQNKGGKAKPYQVRQVIEALDKLQGMKDGNNSQN